MSGKHHEVSYYAGSRSSGTTIRKYFSSYKNAVIYANELKDVVGATDIREQLFFNYHDHLAVVPVSQITDKMFIPIVVDNKILLDEIVNIKIDGSEISYNIEVAKSGNMVVNNILSHNCIYSWRGANPDNVLDFEKEFVGAKIIKLEKNYRSTNNIVTAANAIISKVTGKWRDKLLTLNTDNAVGSDIILREFYNREQEASYVASEISKLKTLNKYGYGNFAVLVRLTYLTRHIEEALMDRRIPYQIIGGLKFSHRKEIRDMVSYLSFIKNPKDVVAFDRIINVPSRSIGTVAINKIKSCAGENFVERLKKSKSLLSKKQIEEVDKFLRVFDLILPKAENFPYDALMYIYNSFSYDKYLQEKFKVDAYDRIENVKELFAMLKTAQLNKKTLSEFLEMSKLAAQQDDINEKDTVKVMTIHAAKGLEFPVVFMIGLEEGILPCKMATTTEQIQEERRLFYVAMTRPKEHLRMSYATSEYDHKAGVVQTIASRYVKEMKDYVRFV